MTNRLGNGWWLAILIQLLGVLAALWLVIPVFADQSLAEQMGDAGWIQRNRNAARQLIPYIQVTIGMAALGAVCIPVICTLVWFVYLWRVPVEAPGDARRSSRVWYMLGIIGTSLCFVFGAALFWSSQIQIFVNPDVNDIFDRIRPSSRLVIMFVMTAYFWISYYLVGTLFTTPALFRTAVPLASLRTSN